MKQRVWQLLLSTCTVMSSFCAANAQQATRTATATSSSGPASQQQTGPAVRSASNPTQKFRERGLARRNLWFPVYSRNHTPVNPTRTKSVIIETQISSGTPMNLPPGWRDYLLQEQQNEQIQQLPDNSPKADPSAKFAIPTQGSMLICRQRPVTIHSDNYDIFIGGGAIAYVVHTGEELAVYNLSSNRSGDITVKAPESKQVYAVEKGHALILTEASDFSGSRLGKFIWCRRTWLMAKEGGVNVYGARFSYLNALERCPQFQSGLASNDRNQRKITNRLLKLSAASLLSEQPP